MASLADHQAQAERNIHARKAMDDFKQAPEWVVTIAFYEGLHWFEALCAHLQVAEPHCDHGSRNALIKKDPRFRPIWAPWKKLYDASVWARYLDAHPGVPRIDARSPVLVNLATGQWLHQIRQFAQRQLPVR